MAYKNHKNKFKIYKKREHLIFVFFIIILPFAFLFSFSKFAHIASGKLFSDLFISSVRLFVSYIIAALLAWSAAALFYKGRRSDIALPVFDVLQSFPTFAALPIAVFFWGSSNFTIIFFLIITIVWPIFFTIISSLKMIRRDTEEAIKIYNIHGFNYFKKFLLPITVPGLITGTIIGLGEGWEALVATEIIVGVRDGLGNFFNMFSKNISITAFGILGLLIFIFSLNKLIWLPLLEWSHNKIED